MGEWAKSGIAGAFSTLVGPDIPDDRIDLSRAALVIARTEYPDLDVNHYVARIYALAERVRGRLDDPDDPREIISALNGVLFDEEGFRGNRDDYYDPRNSFLNDVLERRLGVPITLSLLYMEVAAHVGFQLLGVGMPGHFLLKHYDVEGHELLIDAFGRGQILTPTECQRRLDEIYAGQLSLQPQYLIAVSRRQLLTRLLNNLKTIYLSARNFRKTLPIVDLVLAIYPRSPEDVKQRAFLRYSVNDLPGAATDLETYLNMSPEASDADEMRHTAVSIRRTLAMMN